MKKFMMMKKEFIGDIEVNPEIIRELSIKFVFAYNYF